MLGGQLQPVLIFDSMPLMSLVANVEKSRVKQASRAEIFDGVWCWGFEMLQQKHKLWSLTEQFGYEDTCMRTLALGLADTSLNSWKHQTPGVGLVAPRHVGEGLQKLIR